LLTKLRSIVIVNDARRAEKCAAAAAWSLPRRARFLCSGEVSEWSKEAVLKTVEPLSGSGGSNPSLSGHSSLPLVTLSKIRVEGIA
jgi:hypothetical protein